MLISELPQPYKALAEKRREQNTLVKNTTDYLYLAFSWFSAREPKGFWYLCDEAKTESELPPYPYE